jgi:hypothetical protein
MKVMNESSKNTHNVVSVIFGLFRKERIYNLADALTLKNLRSIITTFSNEKPHYFSIILIIDTRKSIFFFFFQRQ